MISRPSLRLLHLLPSTSARSASSYSGTAAAARLKIPASTTTTVTPRASPSPPLPKRTYIKKPVTPATTAAKPPTPIAAAVRQDLPLPPPPPDHDEPFALSASEMKDALPEVPPSLSSSTSASSAPSTRSVPSAPSAPSAPSSAPSSTFPTTAFPSSPIWAPQTPAPIPSNQHQAEIDWTTSFHGISSSPVSERAAEILMRPLLPNEVEIKPDGLLYLPEILYRRILHKAFGPGGWGMVPRGEMTVVNKMVSREWGLVAGGRLVSVARGEQTFFDPSGLPTATEGCKSNALMRCCKDLGIASELWDPSFIRTFKAAHCVEAWTEHASTKKRSRRWRKKGNKFDYPLIEEKK